METGCKFTAFLLLETKSLKIAFQQGCLMSEKRINF
jgi:hypothetical protein